MGTKERILEAAKRRFDRQGIAGVSMRLVATDLALSPMALYRHYADKDALIDALSKSALDEWRLRIVRTVAADAMTSLEAISEAFLNFALEAPRRFEAAFLLATRDARRFPDDIAAGKSPPLNLVMAHVAQAQSEGLLDRATPPAEVVMSLWALCQGLVSLFRAGRFAGGEKAFRRAYRRAVRRSINSFRSADPNP